MRRKVGVIMIMMLVTVNLANKVVEYVTLNVTTTFRTTCDSEKTFHYTTGFGSGCSMSYGSMKKCFRKWKKNNAIEKCELLRTRKMSILNVHLWLDYLLNPKWHHPYLDIEKIESGTD